MVTRYYWPPYLTTRNHNKAWMCIFIGLFYSIWRAKPVKHITSRFTHNRIFQCMSPTRRINHPVQAHRSYKCDMQCLYQDNDDKKSCLVMIRGKKGPIALSITDMGYTEKSWLVKKGTWYDFTIHSLESGTRFLIYLFSVLFHHVRTWLYDVTPMDG